MHPNFAVFPTYPIILRKPSILSRQNNVLTGAAFKLTDQEVTDFYGRSKGSPIPGVPNFDARRVVDGQRKLTVLKQLPTSSAGRKFELRNKVVGVYDKGKASVVETEQSIVDAQSGEVYSVVNSSAFYVGQGGWGGPKGLFYHPGLL